MDYLIRIRQREYHSDPNIGTANSYIKALERAISSPTDRNRNNLLDDSRLLDIWVSLVIGLLDPHGVNASVMSAISSLTEAIFGVEAEHYLWDNINSADGGFFFNWAADPGIVDETLKEFFREIGYNVCQSHPSPRPSYDEKCAKSECKCPGGYTSVMDDLKSLCFHHFQMEQSQPRIMYDDEEDDDEEDDDEEDE